MGSLVVGKPGFKLLKVGLAIKKKGIGYISCWVVSSNNHVYPILFLSRNIYTHTYIYIYYANFCSEGKFSCCIAKTCSNLIAH